MEGLELGGCPPGRSPWGPSLATMAFLPWEPPGEGSLLFWGWSLMVWKKPLLFWGMFLLVLRMPLMVCRESLLSSGVSLPV